MQDERSPVTEWTGAIKPVEDSQAVKVEGVVEEFEPIKDVAPLQPPKGNQELQGPQAAEKAGLGYDLSSFSGTKEKIDTELFHQLFEKVQKHLKKAGESMQELEEFVKLGNIASSNNSDLNQEIRNPQEGLTEKINKNDNQL